MLVHTTAGTRWIRPLAVAGLFAVTIACYMPAASHEFVNYDDIDYVTDNQIVQRGLTWQGVRWAFTNIEVSNWHPVTWLSHMLDCQLFGLRSGGHHLMSAAIHALNAVVLWLVLARLTGHWWRAGLVAMLFSLHPLRVESVAWASERKDLLAALFGFLAMGAYAGYARQGGLWRWVSVAALMAISLMSKPMLVTLPCLLLLLDYWPLRRMHAAPDARAARTSRVAWLVVEKLPLFALAAISSAVALLAQSRGGAMSTLDQVPLDARVANSVVGFGWYAWKSICPTNLCVLYPYPAQAPVQRAVIIGAVLLVGIAAAFVVRRRAPHLLVGLLWYLGTLVPVIGLVQVGSQAVADRYSYIPAIGLYLMVAWSWPSLRRAAVAWNTASAVLIASLLAAMTIHQVGYWKDNFTLFQRALTVNPANHLAHVQVGSSLEDAGRTSDAIEHYLQAVTLRPDLLEPKVYLGNALMAEGWLRQAADLYRSALATHPRSGELRHNLGNVLLAMGEPREAVEHLQRAVEFMPRSFDAAYNLGNALFATGRFIDAASQFRRATELDPHSASAFNNLGASLAAAGHYAESIEHFDRARSIDPDFPGLDFNAGSALEALGLDDAAADRYRAAIARKADDALAHARLGRIEERAKRFESALRHYRLALEHDPRLREAEAAIARLEATGP